MTRIRRWIEMTLSCSQSRRGNFVRFELCVTISEASLSVLVEIKKANQGIFQALAECPQRIRALQLGHGIFGCNIV